MTKSEIALQLTLVMIGKGRFYEDDSTNAGVGAAAFQIFNTIYSGLMCPDDERADSVMSE